MAQIADENRVPDHIYNHPILRHFWSRMHLQNKNLLIAIVGETGSGKSYAGLSLGATLDRNFSISEVAFEPTAFIELAMDKSYPAGSLVMADESGVSMSHREWWSKANRKIGEIIQTWRHQNRGAIFTMPSLDLLDKVIRNRMHYILTMEDIDWRNNRARARVKINQQNAELGKVYRKNPRIDDSGRINEIPFLHFGMPPEELRVEYEEKKDEFTDRVNEGAYDEVRSMAEDEDTSLDSPKPVAQHILDEDLIEEYTRYSKGKWRVDDDLIAIDFDLSQPKSRQTKKLLERDDEVQALFDEWGEP